MESEKKKSKVYYFDMHAENEEQNLIHKIKQIFSKANLGNVIKEGDLVAIKVHFGEWGNDTFLAPWYVAVIIDEIKKLGGKPFITDTNTLYIGKRKNAVDHLTTAIKHGYSYATVGAPLIIADGLTGKNITEVPIDSPKRKHFDRVVLASDIVNADAMIVISHFKGHVMAGFGGAIKNMAMGCAPAQGKREQHSARPESDHELCTGCAICTTVCPESCIEIIDGKSVVDGNCCIGCGECISHCPEDAMKLNWETEIPEFTERMTEYAYGVWKQKNGKIGFINLAMNITPDCDCMSWSEQPIAKDLGIFASLDPVAIDAACYDLVLKETTIIDGLDIFKQTNKGTQGEIQLEYGEKLGMGSKKYELKKLTI